MGALWGALGLGGVLLILMAPNIWTGFGRAFGSFIGRPIFIVVALAGLYFLLAAVFNALVVYSPVGTVFEFMRTHFPSQFNIVRWLFYLSGMDVFLAVMPAFIGARFVIKRLTIPIV